MRSGRQLASVSPPKDKKAAAKPKASKAAAAAPPKKEVAKRTVAKRSAPTRTAAVAEPKATRAAAAKAVPPKRQIAKRTPAKSSAPTTKGVSVKSIKRKPGEGSESDDEEEKAESESGSSGGEGSNGGEDESKSSDAEEDESDGSEDAEEEEKARGNKKMASLTKTKTKAPTPLRNKAKAPPPTAEEEEEEKSSEDESGSDVESRSSDDEAEIVVSAPDNKSRATPTKKEEVVPIKKSKEMPAKKEAASSGESGGEDESEDDLKVVAPVPLQKGKSPGAKKKKGEISSDEDDGGSSGSDDDGDDDQSSGESEGGDGKDKGFTDENADWLRPKKAKKMQLMSDDDDEAEDDEFAAASEDDDEEMLDVERQSRVIDAELALEKEEAEAEMRRTIAQQTSVFHLPTPEELEDDGERVIPPSEIRARIEDVLEVLGDFKRRREPGRSRSEYVERLSSDMAELFGYLQELVDYFLSMFGPTECLEFLEASDRQRPLVVRANTLKSRRKDLAAALMKRGVRLDPLATWSKVGLKILESTVPIGATPEYLAGHYMLQSAASMCPVMALGPQPGDRVLDLSAAPGGKTSYISQLMRNKGVVIANDLKPERQKATVANLHRLGVRNVVTCCYDGRKFGSLMRNSFDRILLDAPCSGLGVISRDPSVKVQRTISDVKRCAHLQKELLVAAVDALNHKSKKGGGYMVYSTCSVAVAENEEVVNYLLSKRDVKLVDTGLDFGQPGFTRYEHKRFHPSIALTRRFYPHVHNMDGFYVAKILKLSDKRKGEDEKKGEEATDEVAEENVEKVQTKEKEMADTGKETQGAKKKKKQKGKKRRTPSKDGDAGDDIPRKKSKMSHNPNVGKAQTAKKNKNKTNAKMNKPRRMKVTGM